MLPLSREFLIKPWLLEMALKSRVSGEFVQLTFRGGGGARYGMHRNTHGVGGGKLMNKIQSSTLKNLRECNNEGRQCTHTHTYVWERLLGWEAALLYTCVCVFAYIYVPTFWSADAAARTLHSIAQLISNKLIRANISLPRVIAVYICICAMLPFARLFFSYTSIL